MSPEESAAPTPGEAKAGGGALGLVRRLSLLDATLLVAGGVVGSAIFLTPRDVAQALPSPPLFLLVWVAGGVVSLMGAIAFAELGAMFPEAGGQYVYLREAFGELAAFLYGWLMFVAGSTGGIATIAVAFAEYLGQAAPVLRADVPLLTLAGWQWHAGHLVRSPWSITQGDLVAVGAIAGLTIINVAGLRPAVLLQNTATWLKYGVLAVFVVLGFAAGKGSWSHFRLEGVQTAFAGGFYGFMSVLGVAFIAVFWAYEGWVYAAWTAGEIRRPERNVPRSMIAGVVGVMVLYVVMNAVYLYALPTSEIARQPTIAQAAANTLFSPAVGFWIAGVIAVSCFGACSSNILAGARVVYAMGRDGVFFRRMGEVHPRHRTPMFALLAQGALACAIALTGTYDQLFTFTVFGMVLSYVATTAALFVLRRTRPDATRPYRCFGYPWLPALYMLLIGGWLVNTVIERPREAVWCLILLAIGLPGYVYWRHHGAGHLAADG